MFLKEQQSCHKSYFSAILIAFFAFKSLLVLKGKSKLGNCVTEKPKQLFVGIVLTQYNFYGKYELKWTVFRTVKKNYKKIKKSEYTITHQILFLKAWYKINRNRFLE